jgi:hypothetical protein
MHHGMVQAVPLVSGLGQQRDLHAARQQSFFAAPPVRPDQRVVAKAVTIAGRQLQATSAFGSYWWFAAERHRVYEKRLAGEPPPWTSDPVIAEHRFTNAFRAADRASQYLIRNVIYAGDQDPVEIVFRVLLFKFFNKIETWELLCAQTGIPQWRSFEYAAYESALRAAKSAGEALYSPAYVVPPPRQGETAKYANHLRLLEGMMRRGFADQVMGAGSLREVYETLIAYPSIGRFLGFQFAIDLNYSNVLPFDEMDFVVAGPGARDGVRKCFGAASNGIEEDVIAYVAREQSRYFGELGLEFDGLFGRPLQLVDCQNLFCELDKYARVMHPEITGISGRQRIKQRYRGNPQPVTAWFPPKWGLRTRIET